MKTDTTKNRKYIYLVIAVFAICIIPMWVRGALQSAGVLPTSIPASTRTPYIAPFHLTQTAKPTNTPFPTWTPEPTKSPEEHTWSACVLFIERELKLSTFDAQRYNPDGVIKAGDDYLVDVYYATNDVTYTCFMTRDTNGDWLLRELTKK